MSDQNNKLSPKQIEITEDLQGSSLVVAVPGAGKTTILLERMNNLIQMGIDPKKILTISFSRAAANELRDRFNARYDVEISPDFHTIHAFAFMILRDYQNKTGKTYKLLEGHPQLSKYSLLSDINYHYNKEYLSEEQLDSLINDIGYIKNMMMDPDDKSFKSSANNFKDIYHSFEKYKQEHGLIDFDDMLSLGLWILKNDTTIRNKYTNKYDYIQVDEGQDTSKIQMEIIKTLTKDRDNLFLVADDDQSIYSFRGADPTGILNLKADYPDMDIYYLETNYRSSKNIVEASNRFISSNKTRFKKALVSNKNYHKPVDIIKVSRPKDQYQYILDNSTDLDHTGVLYRNNISAMGLIEYLEDNDVPFRIPDNSRLRFLTNRVAQDLIHILQFSEDMSDLNSLSEIFYKVNGYISRAQINYLKTQRRSANLLDSILDMPGRPDFYVDSIGNLKRQFKVLAGMDFRNKLQYIAYDMGYSEYLDQSSKKLDKGVQNQKLLLDNMIQISKSVDSMELFVGRLEYLDGLVATAQERDTGISLSTIHSAKGREYPTVFLIDCYEGVFPNIQDDDPVDTVEEERRLFYVGMTRAMEELHILYPDRVIGDKTEESRFVAELKKI